MKKFIVVCMAVSALMVLADQTLFSMSCHSGHRMDKDARKNSTDRKPEVESFTATVYICPMHPEVRKKQQGACHTCGMTLQEKEVLKYRIKKPAPQQSNSKKDMEITIRAEGVDAKKAAEEISQLFTDGGGI